MTHIIPVLHDAVVNRVRYIKLMPQVRTAFTNNNILNKIQIQKFKLKIKKKTQKTKQHLKSRKIKVHISKKLTT